MSAPKKLRIGLLAGVIVALSLAGALLFGTSSAAITDYYDVSLHYNASVLSLDNVSVLFNYNFTNLSPTWGSYTYKVFSYQNVLTQGNFSISLTDRGYFLDNQSGQLVETDIDLNSTSFDIEIPYFANADRIEFYGPSATVLLSVNVKGIPQAACRDLTC